MRRVAVGFKFLCAAPLLVAAFLLPAPWVAGWSAMDYLTAALAFFALVQVGLQWRTESQRQKERQQDREEAQERAYNMIWTEHFRVKGLAMFMRRPLLDLAFTDVLRPSDVLPPDVGALTEAVSVLSEEAAILGGAAIGAAHEAERAMAVYVRSVHSFSQDAPQATRTADKLKWLEEHVGDDLKPWEDSAREQVTRLAALWEDVAKQHPRAGRVRRLNFQAVESVPARDIVSAFVKKVNEEGHGSK